MRILIDYENLQPSIQQKGTLHLADQLFECLRQHLGNTERLELMLYGGWFEESNLTRKAQDLTVELDRGFPYPLLTKDSPSRLLRITAALVHSLQSLPRKPIHNTLRYRPPARRFTCDKPTDHGCSAPPCALNAMVDFVNDQKCPQLGCGVKPKQLFRGRAEQKLVDTMMVADIIHLAHVGEPALAIVSSDDDLWPGIQAALISGTHVFHVLTGMSRSSIGYATGVPGPYVQTSLTNP